MLAAFLIASGAAQQFLSILLLHDSSGEVGGAALGGTYKKISSFARETIACDSDRLEHRTHSNELEGLLCLINHMGSRVTPRNHIRTETIK